MQTPCVWGAEVLRQVLGESEGMPAVSSRCLSRRSQLKTYMPHAPNRAPNPVFIAILMHLPA